METLLRASHEEYSKRGKSAALIIDSGARVPLQQIVDVIDMARKVGIKDVEFGLGFFEFPK
jgi:hypothetical protein